MKTREMRNKDAKKIDLSLLETLYNLHSPSGVEDDIQSYCIDHAQATGAKVTADDAGNLYITKGSATLYGCFAAHMDEVHQTRTKYFKTHVIGQTIYGYEHRAETFSGIGADDKNGIYIILKMLEEVENLKAVLFTEEEVGCVGSRAADMTFFDNCKYVVQIDRRGNSDFITSAAGEELCTNSFYKNTGAAKFGYKTTSGLLTDVAQLKENGLNVAACNISAGYYNPHTDNEYTNLADLQNCHNLCLHIANNVTAIQPHAPKKSYSIYPAYNYDPYRQYKKADNGALRNTYDVNNYYEDDQPASSADDSYLQELEDEEIKTAIEDIVYTDGYIDRLHLLNKEDGNAIIAAVRRAIGYNADKGNIAEVYYYVTGHSLLYDGRDYLT